jgi:hypothetical protein
MGPGHWKRLGLVLSLLAPGLARGADIITADDVFDAWRVRTEVWETCRLEWVEERTYLRGSLYAAPRSQARTDDPSARPVVPERDTVQTTRATILADGSRVRLDRRDAMWDAGELRFFPTEQRIVWRPDLQSQLLRRLEGEDRGIVAEVYPGDAKDGPPFTQGDFAPMVAIRPLAAHVKAFADRAAWNVDTRSTSDHSEELVILRRRGQAFARSLALREREAVCYVDPSRDFHVVRYEIYHGREPSFTLEIDYVEHADFGWALSGWRGMVFKVTEAGPELQQQWTAKVTDVSPRLESNDGDPFALAFPVGVTVHDQRDQTRWRFRADGTKEILPDPRAEQENAQAVANDPSAMIGPGVLGMLVLLAAIGSCLRWYSQSGRFAKSPR